MVGEFVGKDVAVVRKTAAEVGSDLASSTTSSTSDLGVIHEMPRNT